MKRALLCGAVLLFSSACGGGGGADGVVAPPDNPTPPAVASVSVSLVSAQIVAGNTTSASAEVRAANGSVLTGRSVSWSSSAPGVASVDGAGTVTAIAAGSASITATSEGRSGSATLTVTPIPVASVTVTLLQTSIEVGSSTTASAVVRDQQGNALAGRTITWTSSSAAVATVDAAGVVTAVGPGSTVITATSEGQAGSMALTVTEIPVALVTVVLAQTEVIAGTTTTATASPRAANGIPLAGRAVSWASSNASVATVDGTGRVVAVTPGTATISATSEGRTGNAQLTVLAVPVASVSVSGPTLLTAGVTTQLTAIPRDANGAVLQGRSVVWGTSNNGVATVSATGLLTAIAPGSVTISANSEGRTGSLTLEVRSGVASVTVTGNFRVKAGDSYPYTATARAADGTVLNRPVTWRTLEPNAGSFTSDGVFTPIAAGTITIVATVDGEEWEGTVEVYDWRTFSSSGSLFLTLPADNQITNRRGQSEYADLVFVCSSTGNFFAWVMTDRFITSSGGVALSFDGAPPFGQVWDESNDFSTLFRPGTNSSTKAFALQVAAARVFGFAFTEFQGPSKAMLFRVTGLSLELPPLLSACPSNNLTSPNTTASAVLALEESGLQEEVRTLRAERMARARAGASESVGLPAALRAMPQLMQAQEQQARRRP